MPPPASNAPAVPVIGGPRPPGAPASKPARPPVPETKVPPKPPVPMPKLPPKPVLTPGGNPGVMPAPAQTGVMIGGEQTCPVGVKLAHSSDAQSVPDGHGAPTMSAPGIRQSPP